MSRRKRQLTAGLLHAEVSNTRTLSRLELGAPLGSPRVYECCRIGSACGANGTSPPAPLHAERGAQQLRHVGDVTYEFGAFRAHFSVTSET